MNSNDHLNTKNLTDDERAEAREAFFGLLKEVGDHLDLNALNKGCLDAKNKGEVTAEQLKGILLLNVSVFLKRIDQEFEEIALPEWVWFFQALGKLNLDPRYFLTQDQINSLNELG